MKIDCTLYLVTDSTPAILGKSHFEDVVRAAVEGGTPVSSSKLTPWSSIDPHRRYSRPISRQA